MLKVTLRPRALMGKMDGNLRETVRTAPAALIMKTSGSGFSFIFNIAVARLLGATGAGIYSLAFSFTLIGSIVGRIGMDVAALRFAAAHAALEEWDLVAGAARKSVRFATTMSGVVAGFTFAGAPVISRVLFHQPGLTTPLRIMALGVVPFSLLMVYAQLLKAMKRVAQGLAIESLGIPLLSLPLLMWAGRAYGVRGASAAYVAATVAVLGVSMILWRRATPQLRGIRGEFDRATLVKTALPLFWAASMSMVMQLAGTIMTGIYLDEHSVGIYSAVMRTATLSGLVLYSFNSVVAPQFSRLWAKGERRAVGKLARQAAAVMAVVAGPLVGLLIFAPRFVLGLFGHEFRAGGTALAIIACGQFVNVITGSVGYLLIMTGHQKDFRNVNIVAAFTFIGLNAVLIPKFGIVGAASAFAIVVSAMNLAMVWIVYRRIGMVTLPIPSRWIERRGRHRHAYHEATVRPATSVTNLPLIIDDSPVLVLPLEPETTTEETTPAPRANGARPKPAPKRATTPRATAQKAVPQKAAAQKKAAAKKKPVNRAK